MCTLLWPSHRPSAVPSAVPLPPPSFRRSSISRQCQAEGDRRATRSRARQHQYGHGGRDLGRTELLRGAHRGGRWEGLLHPGEVAMLYLSICCTDTCDYHGTRDVYTHTQSISYIYSRVANYVRVHCNMTFSSPLCPSFAASYFSSFSYPFFISRHRTAHLTFAASPRLCGTSGWGISSSRPGNPTRYRPKRWSLGATPYVQVMHQCTGSVVYILSLLTEFVL